MTGKYGARTEEVAAIIARLKTLTNEEVKALDLAYDATDRYTVEYLAYLVTEALLDPPLKDYWKAACFDALEAGPRFGWDFVWFDPRQVALPAILAIIARDHITPEQYAILYTPWASVMVEEGPLRLDPPPPGRSTSRALPEA